MLSQKNQYIDFKPCDKSHKETVSVDLYKKRAPTNSFQNTGRTDKAKLTPSKKPIFGEGSRRPEGFMRVGG